jgi:Pyridoxal phosphate biosynthesis protein
MKNNGDNSISNQPVLGITMGDPAGIGPEVVVKALADPEVRRSAKFIIFGMHEQLAYAADRAEIEPFWGRYQHEKITTDIPCKVVVADYDEYSVPSWIKGPSRAAGEASIRFCLDAIDAARADIIDAVTTAPISKTSWNLAGAKWPGHTEMLADRCKSQRYAMMFVAGPMKLALAASLPVAVSASAQPAISHHLLLSAHNMSLAYVPLPPQAPRTKKRLSGLSAPKSLSQCLLSLTRTRSRLSPAFPARKLILIKENQTLKSIINNS